MRCDMCFDRDCMKKEMKRCVTQLLQARFLEWKTQSFTHLRLNKFRVVTNLSCFLKQGPGGSDCYCGNMALSSELMWGYSG